MSLLQKGPSRSKVFARRVFESLSKRELCDFLEILHCATEAESEQDVVAVLRQLHRIVPYEHLVPAIIRLTSASGSEEFCHFFNVSHPENWLPFDSTKIDSAAPKSESCSRADPDKQGDVIELWRFSRSAAERPAESSETGRGLRRVPASAGQEPDEASRYTAILEYVVHRLHQTLLKRAVPSNDARVVRLTPRERSVLNWIGMGKTNWEIARILGVSERTARFHVESILNKLSVTSRTQAVALAVEHGLYTPPPSAS